MSESLSSVLWKYVPEPLVGICCEWIVRKNIHLRITGMRSSKLGDYRPLEPGKGHQITVNHDLNPYAFFITFTHEVAHLVCYERYGPRHEPHGREWKHHFRELMYPFIDQGVFPESLALALTAYLRDPGASSCSDPNLIRTLRAFDRPRAQPVRHLEELPYGAEFRLNGPRSRLHFRKGERLRSRFRCEEIPSGRVYLVSGIAEVIRTDDTRDAAAASA